MIGQWIAIPKLTCIQLNSIQFNARMFNIMVTLRSCGTSLRNPVVLSLFPVPLMAYLTVYYSLIMFPGDSRSRQPCVSVGAPEGSYSLVQL